MMQDKSRELFNQTILQRLNSNLPNPLDAFIEVLGEARKLYGPRVEFFEVKDIVKNTPAALDYLLRVEQNLKKVVMAVQVANIEDPMDGSDCVIIHSKPLKDRKVTEDPQYAICEHMEYSYQQSATSVGTGFFIKENVIATAGHVAVNGMGDFRDLRFVHGIHFEGPNFFKNEIRVHKSKIWKPLDNQVAPDAFYLSKMSSDWALVKVQPAYVGFNNPVIGQVATPTLSNYQAMFVNKMLEGTKVYAIGHGLGLPMKVSYMGKVSWVGVTSPYFETDLALLGGNSGSPVFDANTHELIGIYIRGTKKLVFDTCGDGIKKLVIKDEASRYEGQECQRLEPVLQALPGI